jgi:hypothetical protein
MKTVHKYGVIELSLKSSGNYTYPDRDCKVIADFTGPSGRTLAIPGFWDGGSTWRVRFSPDETGCWKWRTRCVFGNDEGLQKDGEPIECIEYEGNNPLYNHGPLKLSKNCRTLMHEDGTPFFWLGDTAWNGVIRGNDNNWARYLSARKKQRFNLVQFVCCHWRGDAVDEAGEAACDNQQPVNINPAFFQRLDHRVAMINEYGLVAAPVVLWSLLKTDPGYRMPEDDATRLAEYIVARYDAFQVVWFLGGDGRYQEIGIDRWKRIGRAVFSSGHDRLVTLHPCGLNWISEEFREEDWYDIAGYQSGHCDSDEEVSWLVKGEPAMEWNNTPPLPVINLEPNYETAHGYTHNTIFTDYHVRRDIYWSLLVSPTAGVTYGHDAVWNWNFETGPSEGHDGWHDGSVPPWDTGIVTPGIECVTVMRGIFERLDWTTIRPCQELLAEQPGEQDIAAFIVAGRSADGTVVLYSPCGGKICFAPGAKVSGPIRLVDPKTGNCIRVENNVEDAVELPEGQDWLIVCGTGWKECL